MAEIPSLDAYVLDRLVCPLDRTRLEPDGAVLHAAGGATYACEDGIVDFLAGAERPAPRFYDDPDYRTLRASMDRLHAAHYEAGSVSNRVEEAAKRDLLRLAGGRLGGSGPLRGLKPVVDLGCGSGSGFAAIGRPERIIGVDSDLALLRLCRARYPEATLIRADLANLPFRDHAFPAMHANAVLEHVFALEAALAELHRCLEADGRLYVGIPGEGGLAIWLARRLVTGPRNARILGVSTSRLVRAMRFEHCNSAPAVEGALRKRFVAEATRHWPLVVGGLHLNLTKSYRLKPR